MRAFKTKTIYFLNYSRYALKTQYNQKSTGLFSKAEKYFSQNNRKTELVKM